MKTPKHVPILRANLGECEAVSNLDKRTRARILPLFDVGVITDAIRDAQYMQRSSTPTITHLERTLDRVIGAWSGRLAVVDGYHWAADARTETGVHIIAHMARYLRANGVPTIPVIGYDRWGNTDYRSGVRSARGHEGDGYCLRLDGSAIEDSLEPDHFTETIEDIVETVGLVPEKSFALIDLGDVSLASVSIDYMIERTEAIVGLLSELGFGFCVVAGCSLPSTIDKAVGVADTEAAIPRKEFLAWRAMREDIGSTLVSGDYGVRGPTTTEARSKYTNGKIRYTIPAEYYIVRGHAFFNDGDYSQLASLAETLVTSVHYLGIDYSWGDGQIDACRSGGRPGNLSHWIAIDTNHHLTFVVEEVEEFERSLVDEEADEDEDSDA